MYRSLFGETSVPFVTAPAASGPNTCTVFLIDRICASWPPESRACRRTLLRRSDPGALKPPPLVFDTSESHDLAEPGVRRFGDRLGVVGAETERAAARKGKATRCTELEGVLGTGIGTGPS